MNTAIRFGLTCSIVLCASALGSRAIANEPDGHSASRPNALAFAAQVNASCLDHQYVKAKEITHYMIPLLDAYDHKVCDLLEGTCIYNKAKVPWLHNYGYADQPLAEARCKNGYGNNKNCLHPCRVVAASMSHHHYGQIIFIKDLVGKKCGNLKRDGFEITHDGFVAVLDTGSPVHFHESGRFDFFWGRCKDDQNGVCKEGAEQITNTISKGDYCIVWDPQHPHENENVKNAFVQVVKAEASNRGDLQAASEFELDSAASPFLGLLSTPAQELESGSKISLRSRRQSPSLCLQ